MPIRTRVYFSLLHARGCERSYITGYSVGLHVNHSIDLRGYADCGVEHRPNMANSAPTIADLDGDGAPEIVIVGNVYNCGTDLYRPLQNALCAEERPHALGRRAVLLTRTATVIVAGERLHLPYAQK